MRAQAQRRAILLLRLRHIAAPRIVAAEHRAPLGPVRVEALRGHKFLLGLGESRAIRRLESLLWRAGEQKRGFDPHTAHRIVEKRAHDGPKPPGLRRFQLIERGEPHQRVRICEPFAHRSSGLHRRESGEFLEGAGAGEGRRLWVRGHRLKQGLGIRCAFPRRLESRSKCLEPFALGPEPVLDGGCRPFRRLARVAIGTGIVHAQGHGQIGTRHPEAMIVPRVDHHELAGGHVAGDAARRVLALMVRMTCLRIAWRMALQADLVAFGTQTRTVRLVAVAARHPCGKHLALLE